MATTGIWPVKSDLNALIRYAENPDKTTTWDRYAESPLHKVLEYDMNDNKTEKRLFVSGVNCIQETAYERMITTKTQFGKTDGVIAYHAFQSFKEGEVTPEQCHYIGLETARRLWGDRFEVLVASHVSGRHMHNHFCINSVSFVDGKKFSNKRAEHIRLREVSDEICKEKGLSVLYNSNFYSNSNKKEYWKNKSAGDVEKQIIRMDLCEAAERSKNITEFYTYLRELGYYINRNHNYAHISVTPPGWNKTVRIDAIVPKLTNEGLMNILWLNYDSYRRLYPKFNRRPLDMHDKIIRRYKEYRDNTPSFIDVIVAIVKLALGIEEYRNENPRPVLSLPAFRKESAVLKEHQSMVRFVSKHNIKTPDDICNVAEKCKAKMDELIAVRKRIYNRIRRPKPTDSIQKLKAGRDSITREISEAREQMNVANKLLEMLYRLEKEVDEELELERCRKERTEPATADEISRRINDKDYEPDEHYVISEDDEDRTVRNYDR